MDRCAAHLFRLDVHLVPEICTHDYTKVTTGSLDSKELVEQPRKAPPMGRALRILLGLVLMIYVVPVYFKVPAQVAAGSLLLVLGLIGVYILIHIFVSRRIVSFSPGFGALVAN